MKIEIDKDGYLYRDNKPIDCPFHVNQETTHTGYSFTTHFKCGDYCPHFPAKSEIKTSNKKISFKLTCNNGKVFNIVKDKSDEFFDERE